MKDTIDEFIQVIDRTGCDQTVAAILVLANAVKDAAPFNRANAENFGHELSIALKNVFECSEISVRSKNDVMYSSDEVIYEHGK